MNMPSFFPDNLALTRKFSLILLGTVWTNEYAVYTFEVFAENMKKWAELEIF